jgi:PAS domain S-box-containing protein
VLNRQAAEQIEHNFHDLLEGLDAGVVLLRPTLDPDGRVVDAEIVWSNRASRALWKRPEGLAPGTRVSAMYYDQLEWLQAANEAWQGRSVSRMLESDADATNWSSASETLRRVGDTIVELTIDRSRDLELLDRLTELDLRFRTLVADLPLTVLVAGPSGDYFDFVSPNAADLTGRPIGELQTLDQWRTLIHPDSLAEADNLVRQTSKLGRFETVVRMVRPDGTEASVWVRTLRRMMPDGPSGFIGLMNDITEQERFIKRVASGERLETLGRTAGSIAHDFNNLLMIVAGNIERAARQLGPDNMALSTALVATQRAAELASNLLGFAKGRPGSPRWVQLDEVLRTFEPILRGVLFPHSELRLEIERDLPSVWTDPAHVEQILLNLVTNARDAMGSGGVATVRFARVDGAQCHLFDSPGQGPHVAISVSDTGTGVPEHLINQIWEPFFSGKKPTEDSGTGLGLSTVHGLAHQHGGHAVLVSTPGEGTTVTVYLPVSPNQR